MNPQTTIEKMKSMRLKGMAEMYDSHVHDSLYNELTRDEYISLLVQQEWESRQGRKTNNLITTAKFRSQADIRNIDYGADRNLDKNSFDRLCSLRFIDQKENIIITGATGTGKSYLAQAIGHQACLHQNKTKYFTMSALVEELQMAKIQGTYHKLIRSIQSCSLLILDDFGLAPFDNLTRQALMDIVEYKYDQSSMIITSQIPIGNWHEMIGEGTIADAILDRLIHSSHRIALTGESMRRNKKVGLGAKPASK